MLLFNELQVVALQYDADAEGVVCTHTYTHPAEVWDIAPCPTSEELFLTVWSKGTQPGCTCQHSYCPPARSSASKPNLPHVLLRAAAVQAHEHLQSGRSLFLTYFPGMPIGHNNPTIAMPAYTPYLLPSQHVHASTIKCREVIPQIHGVMMLVQTYFRAELSYDPCSLIDIPCCSWLVWRISVAYLPRCEHWC